MSLPAEGEGQPHQPEQRPCPPRHPCRYDPGSPPLSPLALLVVIVIWDQPMINHLRFGSFYIQLLQPFIF